MSAERKPDDVHAPLPLRVWLRDETRKLHLDTEAVWMATERFESQDDYNAFLSALLIAHCELGLPAAERIAEANAIQLERKRIDCLCKDLRMAEPLPATPKQMSTSYAWGVGYVLNGSAMGANMLLSQGYVAGDWPKSYMRDSCDFAKSGQLRAFLDQLNALDLERPDVLRGAADTFDIVGTDPRAAG